MVLYLPEPGCELIEPSTEEGDQLSALEQTFTRKVTTEAIFFPDLVLSYLAFLFMIQKASKNLPFHHVLFTPSDRRIQLPLLGSEAERKG